MRLGSILRAPLLHFALFGALLFAASGLLGLPDRRVGSEVGVAVETGDENALDEELLVREALARGLEAGDPGIEARLVQKMLFLDDDASLADATELARRARALGLDREDVVIRRLLAEKLRLLATTLEPSEAPDEAALRRAFAERAETLRTPSRRSLVHVFLSQDRRGARTQADAESLHRRITAQRVPPTEAVGLGDPFPSGHTLVARSRAELARQLGETFAERVVELPVGEWSDPIPSAYGLHLVHVEADTPGEIPSFDSVRERLRLELENDLRERKLAALLAELRTRYEVAVALAGEESN